MRTLLSLSILSLFAPQDPGELWSQGERERAIIELSAELEERESATDRTRLVTWCFAVHKYRAALAAAAGLGEAGDAHRARALYFLGEYEEALALLDERDGEALLMRIEALRALGRDWSEWVESAAKLLGETDSRVLLLRARVQMDKGEHAEAIVGFERVLERAPLDAEARFGLGRSLIMNGDRERGLAVLKRHRELTPLLDALDFAERGLDLAPTHGPNHAALGDAWRDLIPYDKTSYTRADAAYDSALGRMEGAARVPVHLRRARLIADHGAGSFAAAHALDRALEERKDPQLLVRAADYFMEGGDRATAILRLEQAQAMRPRDAAISERIERARRGE